MLLDIILNIVQDTNLNDPQDQSSVLEVVLQGEVYLSNILRRLRVVDVHVHQADGPVLQERHLSVQSGNTLTCRYGLLL